MAEKTQPFSGSDGYFVMNEDQGSAWVHVGQARGASIHVSVDNTDAVGTLRVQASNKADVDNSYWVNLGFPDEDQVIQDGYAVTSGDSFTHIFEMSNITVGWLRLYYERTSGTGGCSFWPIVKR